MMSKITHQKLVKIYQQMGYEVDEIYPDLNITVIRIINPKDNTLWKYKTLLDSQSFDGWYESDTGCVRYGDCGIEFFELP